METLQQPGAPTEFDDAFFAAYEEQLADVNIERHASEALAGILTVSDEEGNTRTYEQIKADTEAFFESSWVQEVTARSDALAIQFAHFCMGHDHGGGLASGSLSSVYEAGASKLTGDEHHDHDHTGHEEHHTASDDGKKKKKKTNRIRQALRHARR